MRQLLTLGIALALLLVLAGCDSATDPTATPTTAPTAATLEGVSIEQLYEEATVNLARYDSKYKGKWYLVTGIVSQLGEYKVFVNAGPEASVHWVLTDLPHSDQVHLDPGDAIAARCKIGEVTRYRGISMESCSLE